MWGRRQRCSSTFTDSSPEKIVEKDSEDQAPHQTHCALEAARSSKAGFGHHPPLRVMGLHSR